MTTKMYLERLLNDEVVLSENVVQPVYQKVDFNIGEAIAFADGSALNVLTKLARIAKFFENHYAEKRNGFFVLFFRNRREKEQRFWKIFSVELAKIRTKRMLMAMTKDGKLRVRRNNLDFNAEAAKEYYLSLSEEEKLLLFGNVSKKADNSFQLYQENRDNKEISSKDIDNYKSSALFWGDVRDLLSSIKIVA